MILRASASLAAAARLLRPVFAFVVALDLEAGILRRLGTDLLAAVLREERLELLILVVSLHGEKAGRIAAQTWLAGPAP